MKTHSFSYSSPAFHHFLHLAVSQSFTIPKEEEDNVLMGNRPFYSMCPLPVSAGLPSPARVQLLPDTQFLGDLYDLP